MSCKPSIDDVQQSAQSLQNEYNIQLVNRAEELNQRYNNNKKKSKNKSVFFSLNRWEHSIASISQRIQSLQNSVKNTDSNIYSNSVEHPWQRAIAMNKIPYYIKYEYFFFSSSDMNQSFFSLY